MHLRTLPGGILSFGTPLAPAGLVGPPPSGRLLGLGLAPPGFLPLDGARVLSMFSWRRTIVPWDVEGGFTGPSYVYAGGELWVGEFVDSWKGDAKVCVWRGDREAVYVTLQ